VDGQAYRPGSRSDFERLFNATYPRILHTLYGILGDHHMAEDCAQDAFYHAFRAWNRWKPTAPAEAWLHRIALNVAYSYRRRERLRGAAELVRRLGRPAPEPDPAEVAERGDLYAALSRLPLKQAAIIVLRHQYGYSNREISVALRIPEATVASRLSAAKTRLKHALQTRREGPSAENEMVTRRTLGVSIAGPEGTNPPNDTN
jgi:RNA polymerase sigma-70 factor (ECF subfamily)